MTIRFDLADHVARITIDRPERMNSFDDETHVAFSQAIDRVQDDDDVWVAVITGAGERAFCAGRDLKWTAAMNAASPEERAASAARMASATRLQDRFDVVKPLIARINGFALGGGLELALACDIIVAADHAELGLPEPRRGLIAGAMGVHRLPRQIPHHLAMGYLLSGRHMTAARAYEIGLVNEVVPAADLDDAVDAWVADILACSPVAVRATKQSALEALHLSLREANRHVAPWEQRRRSSDDAVEGPRAFAERRPPRWTGR
ncbi:MAG: enoyl-CoA hydratase-related protein [Acidimicrobiales bacterium]